MVVELRKSFKNYGPNKHRSCNWFVYHLRISDFYDFYDETNSPLIKFSFRLFRAQMRFYVVSGLEWYMFSNFGKLTYNSVMNHPQNFTNKR